MTDAPRILELFRLYQNGRFRVDRVLGQGGMGTVVQAYDTRLRVSRAIKVFNPELNNDLELRRRFENEAAVMAQIQYEHIVRVFDSFEIEDCLCMVLEWMDGGTLTDHLSMYGALQPKQAIHLTLTICQALAVAHKHGVIHRDIKPDNILFTKSGVPKVGDFGIAHIDQNSFKMTANATALGTLGYMSPEQMYDAKEVDARADVHALGVTLWVMFSVMRPPGLSFVNEIDHKPELMETIPEVLRPIIRKSVDYDPNNRYRSIEHFSDVLEGALDQLPEDSSVWEFGRTKEVMETAGGSEQAFTPKTHIPKRTPSPIEPDEPEPEPTLVSDKPLMTGYGKAPEPFHEPKRFGFKWVIAAFAILFLAGIAFVWRFWILEPPLNEPMQAQTHVQKDVDALIEPDGSLAQEIVATQPVPTQIASAVLLPTEDSSVLKEEKPVVDPVRPQKALPKADSKTKEKKGEPSLEPKEKKMVDPVPEVPKPQKIHVGLQVPDGDQTRVWLVGSQGKIKMPGSVVPGIYRVVAQFNQEAEVTVISSLNVTDGSSLKLVCSSAFANCKVR